MKRLILLRHGLTPWNVEWRFQGQADIELAQAGHAQARAAATVMASYGPEAVWSSDLSRAVQTAEYVAEATQLVPVVDERLREIHVGEIQGLTYPEVVDKIGPAPRDYTEYGGESDTQVGERFAGALSEITEGLGEDGTAVVVSHGHAIRVGLAYFLGWPEEARESLTGMTNCGWAELVENREGGAGGPWRLAAYNRVSSIS